MSMTWLAGHGPNIRLMFTELFLGRGSAFFGLDAIVSTEGTRRRIGMLWVPVTATCFIAVSSGFPLVLYLRERQCGLGP